VNRYESKPAPTISRFRTLSRRRLLLVAALGVLLAALALWYAVYSKPRTISFAAPVSNFRAGLEHAYRLMSEIDRDAQCYAVGADVRFREGRLVLVSPNYLLSARVYSAYVVEIDNRQRTATLISSGAGISDPNPFRPLDWGTVRFDVSDLPAHLEQLGLPDVTPKIVYINLCRRKGKQVFDIDAGGERYTIDAMTGEILHAPTVEAAAPTNPS